MATTFQRRFYTASTALTLSLVAYSAQAYQTLPNLVNLNFSDYSGLSPKNSFAAVDPVGWTGGSGLIFINLTSGLNKQAASPVYLTTYGNPAGSYSGNYVEADGNPSFESGFNYTVTGLTVGDEIQLELLPGRQRADGVRL